MAGVLSDLSHALEQRVSEGARLVAAVSWGGRAQLSAIVWQSGVLVTSEQNLPESDRYEVVMPFGERAAATLAGRDSTTNVAVLRTSAAASVPAPAVAEPRSVGSLIVAIGSDGEGGATGRIGIVEVLGPAWQSMRGGRIDRLIRIGVQLPSGGEGGPVVDSDGGVLGMSTFGPRRGVMVIPCATLARAAEQLLRQGKIARGWLGVGLHEVALPREIASRAGVDGGLMVMSLADNAPATGRLLPGDILTAIAGSKVASARAVAGILGPETVGQALDVDLVRGGELASVSVVVAARP